MNKAVLLLSGGLDSTTTLAIAIDELAGMGDGNFEIHSLSVLYGQRHQREADSATKVVAYYQARGVKIHQKIALLSLPWKGSALLGSEEIPKDRDESTMSTSIPSTYVPARNTFLLGLATSLAEAIGAGSIYVGFNAIDYSGYVDCRPEFVEAFNKLICVGTKVGVEGNPIIVKAPIINTSKAGVIKRGMELGAPYKYTWSCYEGGLKPCGRCDSCIIRAKGFDSLGLKDPALE